MGCGATSSFFFSSLFPWLCSVLIYFFCLQVYSVCFSQNSKVRRWMSCWDLLPHVAFYKKKKFIFMRRNQTNEFKKLQSFSCNRFIERKVKAFLQGPTALRHVWTTLCNFKSSQKFRGSCRFFFGENLANISNLAVFLQCPRTISFFQKNFSLSIHDKICRFPEEFFSPATGLVGVVIPRLFYRIIRWWCWLKKIISLTCCFLQYIVSSGKDSLVFLWELATGR